MDKYLSEELFTESAMYEIQDSFCTSGIPFEYVMTDGELEWLEFVKGRYSIHDWVTKNLKEDEDGNMVLTFDNSQSMSQALDEDCEVVGKAVCLSDNTALQRLFFHLYTPIDWRDEE